VWGGTVVEREIGLAYLDARDREIHVLVYCTNIHISYVHYNIKLRQRK